MGSDHRVDRQGLIAALLLTIGLCGGNAAAGQADVLGAQIERNPDGTFKLAVTVRHADSGWSHYADRWEVIGPQGETLATRVLLHPHIKEQPFTRSLDAVKIPRYATWVKIRAHDSKHGHGGREVTLSVRH